MFFENPRLDAPSAVSGRLRRRLRRRSADFQKTLRKRLRNGRPGSALGAILGVFGPHLGSVWVHFGVPRRLGEPSGPTAGAKPKRDVDQRNFLTVLGSNLGSLGGSASAPFRLFFGVDFWVCFGSLSGAVRGPSGVPFGVRFRSKMGSRRRPESSPRSGTLWGGVCDHF